MRTYLYNKTISVLNFTKISPLGCFKAHRIIQNPDSKSVNLLSVGSNPNSVNNEKQIFLNQTFIDTAYKIKRFSATSKLVYQNQK